MFDGRPKSEARMTTEGVGAWGNGNRPPTPVPQDADWKLDVGCSMFDSLQEASSERNLAALQRRGVPIRFSGFGFLSGFEFRILDLSPVGLGFGATGHAPFTPCTRGLSLLEAIPEAVRRMTPGDVRLWLSPACSSFDQFRNYLQRGEFFCTATKSIGRGAPKGDPKIDGPNACSGPSGRADEPFAPRFCEGKPPGKNKQHNTSRDN